MLVYDITSQSSFDSVRSIYSEVRRKGRASRPVVIVGSKCDDVGERQVNEETGKRLAKELRCQFKEVSARDGTGLEEVFLGLAMEIDRLKRKEARLKANVNCQSLGRALIEVLEKVSKGLDRLHWKILYWMYGPDKPLRVQPMVRPVSQVVEMYETPRVGNSTSVDGPGALLGGRASKRSLRRTGSRTHAEYESVLMSGGLEITMAEPSGLALPVHRT